jgi:flagellar hook-length control protein FliK
MTISPILPVGNGTGLAAPESLNGLSGLFASLFALFRNPDVATLGAGKPEDLPIEDLMGKITPELKEFADFIIEATDQKGLNPADVIVEFKTVIMEVRQIEIQFGSMNNMDELAMAYEALGFSPEDAAEKAKQVSLIVQLLEAFQKHTLTATQALEDITDTSGILQANEYVAPENADGLRITEIKQTAIAFTATMHMTPKTDFVEKMASKVPLLKNTNLESTALADELLMNALDSGDEQLILDTIFPQEDMPFASLHAILKEVIPAPGDNLRVAEFASAAENKAAAQKQGLDIAAKHVEINAKPNMMAKNAPVITTESIDVEEVVTARNIAESNVAHQQKQATPVIARSAVENTLANKDVRPAASSHIANHNGSTVRGAEVIAPINNKAILHMQPDENGEMKLLNLVINGEQVEGEAEELRFTERLERHIEVAKQNNATLAKTAERAQVAEQVSIQVKNLVAKGGGHIRMTLNPAELGQVEIQLQVKEGKVHGTILAQNLEVIEQMARDLRSLQQSLADAGLELGAEGIQFQLREEHESSQQQASQGNANDEGYEEELEIENPVTSAWTDPDKLIDVSI